MPVSMALAGPVGERIGIPTTFASAALVPPVLAVVAVFAARLPRDEILHPLDESRQPSDEPEVVSDGQAAEPPTPKASDPISR